MINIVFYALEKRRNSTLRPVQQGTPLQCNLKDTCSIVNPVIEVNATMTQYNYCYIPTFDRYYYINDWSYSRGIWTATCTVDVLATYSPYILETTANVVFSSSRYNLHAIDNRIGATGGYTRSSQTASFIGTLANQNTSSSGTYVLTALSNQPLWSTGVTTTYFMTRGQMQSFAKELLDPDPWDALKQFFDNPLDGIVECYYLPLDVSEYIELSEEQAIQVGDYSFTTMAKKPLLSNFTLKSKTAQIMIPWVYDDFRRLSPYTEMSLFVPFCGAKSIPPEMVYNIDMLFVDYSVDVTTGAIQAICYNKSEVIAEFSGNCKVSLPIGKTQSRVDSIIGATGGAITAVAGFAHGNVALGATGVLSAIGSVATPANNKVMGGMNGSVLGAIIGNETKHWQNFILSVTSRDTTDNPANMRPTLGNALNEVVPLSDLRGYVQTTEAQVSAPCTADELTQINTLLDTGIYIE